MAYAPASHGDGSTLGVAQEKPAGHAMQCVQFPDVTRRVFPAGHSTGIDAAVSHVYPAGQLAHSVEPEVAAVGNRSASVSS